MFIQYCLTRLRTRQGSVFNVIVVVMDVRLALKIFKPEKNLVVDFFRIKSWVPEMTTL